MDIIADTNIFLAVALGESSKDRIIEQTSDAKILAPEILPYEVGNALSAMIKRRQISGNDALATQSLIDQIPVRLVTPEIQQSLQLAIEHNIYAYDAYFLNCAQIYSCPLLTLDKRMKQVASELAIDTLE